MSHIEKMLSENSERFAFERGTPGFDAATEVVAEKFGKQNTDTWRSVSTPQFNSIYQDNIVSVVFRAIPMYLDSYNPSAVGRKYFMGKGWVYDKVYVFTNEGSCPLPCPSGGLPMFIGFLVNVYGQPGDEDLTRYKCLYFMHQKHAEVEKWANQKLVEGKYSTFYSATFDTKDNNRMLRMKSYAYDEQGSFSDWDVVHYTKLKALEKQEA